MIDSESQNVLEAAMADEGEGSTSGDGVADEGRSSPLEMAARGMRMLERLIAGLPLTEVAAREGLSPRRARELVAEIVAERGFDP